MQLVHVTCARFADVGKGNEKICRDRGGQQRTVKKSGHLGDQHDAGTEFLTLMLLQMTPLVSVKALRTNPTCRARYTSFNVNIARQETRTHNENIGGCCSKMFH